VQLSMLNGDFIVWHGQLARFARRSPPGRWSFSPGVTCAIKQADFSDHISDEAVLGWKRLCYSNPVHFCTCMF